MNKYIIYCRKSTDEKDRQVLSIEAQVAELKEFAAKERLQIVGFITEAKTAKEPGREKFEEVLKLVEDKKANSILSWHPDRLARNSVDGGKIIYLLDIGKLLDLKFPTFWFENTPQGKFMLNIAFGQSKYYIDNLSENVKRGNRQKLRRGEWPNHAPFGYINDSRTKEILIDRKRAPFFQKAFKLFSTGGYTFVDIRNYFTQNKIFNESGHILHLDKIKRILTDPFYYGVMRFCGEFYEGKHKPLISKKLFDKVQEVVRLHSRKAKKNKYDFPFMGLMKCGECGCTITTEQHLRYYPRTKRKADFTYYRCSKKKGLCNQKYVKKIDMENKIREVVKKVSFSPYVAKKFLEWAENDAKNDKRKSSSLINYLTRQLTQTEEKLDRLLEGYLDKIISSEDYRKKKNELIKNKLTLEGKIKEVSANGNEWLEPFSEFVKRALEGYKIAAAKNNCHDLEIMAKTVGSNFNLKDRQLSVSFRKEGFDALASFGGKIIGSHYRPSIPNLLRDLESDQDAMVQSHVSYH